MSMVKEALRTEETQTNEGRTVAGFVNRAEDIEQVGKRVDHAARIKIPESEHAAVSTACIIRKDGLQRRMALRRGAPLLAGIT